MLQEHHERFHKVWGQLLKTGYQNSRFAHQVERFACLYTSHVSNLCFYSPDKSYRYSHRLFFSRYTAPAEFTPWFVCHAWALGGRCATRRLHSNVMVLCASICRSCTELWHGQGVMLLSVVFAGIGVVYLRTQATRRQY